MPTIGDTADHRFPERPVRLLTFSTLYPNEAMPHNGIFVEQRLRRLLASENVVSHVVAPVPWFPSRNPAFGSYAGFAAVPKREERYGVSIEHPRYPLIPKIGMTLAPVLMATAVYPLVRRLVRDGPGIDLIDAHYFYPDGVAAALLAAWLDKPLTITARGTDVNLIPRYRLARRWILWAARRASRAIAVSDALRDRMIEIGVSPDKVITLRNGVDLELFRPLADREALRTALGFEGRTLLSVGHLIERKGHHLVIEALAGLPDTNLVIAGTGPMKTELVGLVARFGLQDRVRLVGGLTHEDLVRYYNAANALVLASSREGMANVLLESIACGTPVVATPIWGNPEVVADSRAGVLSKDRSVPAIASAISALLESMPGRDNVREYALRFSWDATSRGQADVFAGALQHAERDSGGPGNA